MAPLVVQICNFSGIIASYVLFLFLFVYRASSSLSESPPMVHLGTMNGFEYSVVWNDGSIAEHGQWCESEDGRRLAVLDTDKISEIKSLLKNFDMAGKYWYLAPEKALTLDKEKNGVAVATSEIYSKIANYPPKDAFLDGSPYDYWCSKEFKQKTVRWWFHFDWPVKVEKIKFKAHYSVKQQHDIIAINNDCRYGYDKHLQGGKGHEFFAEKTLANEYYYYCYAIEIRVVNDYAALSNMKLWIGENRGALLDVVIDIKESDNSRSIFTNETVIQLNEFIYSELVEARKKVNISDSLGICQRDIDECVSNPCVNGICLDNINAFECKCERGFTGKLCEIDVDFCEPNPCQNGATCEDGDTYYTCHCVPGYAGTQCSEDIDECASSPCKMGTCIHSINDYYCNCTAGYTGKNCETDIDECASNPCQNNATCINNVNRFDCQCVPGFSGPTCEINIDECEVQPCANNGTCLDGINKYTCNCNIGFTGKNCSINIDDCESNPCQNGGNCIDGINQYRCNCTGLFIGFNCEREMVKDFQISLSTCSLVGSGSSSSFSVKISADDDQICSLNINNNKGLSSNDDLQENCTCNPPLDGIKNMLIALSNEIGSGYSVCLDKVGLETKTQKFISSDMELWIEKKYIWKNLTMTKYDGCLPYHQENMLGCPFSIKGSTCYLKCRKGYTLQGSKSITCTEDPHKKMGAWVEAGVSPSCEKYERVYIDTSKELECPELNSSDIVWRLDGGRPLLSNSHTFRASFPKFVSISCEENCAKNASKADQPIVANFSQLNHCNGSQKVTTMTYLICALHPVQMRIVEYCAAIALIWFVAAVVLLKKQKSKVAARIRAKEKTDDEASKKTVSDSGVGARLPRIVVLVVSLVLLVVKPVVFSLLYSFDVATDWYLFLYYGYEGDVNWAVFTFLFMAIGAVINFFIGMRIMSTCQKIYPRLEDASTKMLYTFLFMFNLGPIFFHWDELLDSLQAWRKEWKDRNNPKADASKSLSHEARSKQSHREKVLAMFSISEVLCEGIGQNTLQLFILRISLGQKRMFLPIPEDLEKTSWDGLRFAEIGDDATIYGRNATCSQRWTAIGPSHCWSKGLSRGMNQGLDCLIADCSNTETTRSVAEYLPLIKLVVGTANMAFTVVRKLYGSHLVKLAAGKKPTNLYLLLGIFTPFVAWSLCSAMFLGCFLGASISIALERDVGSLATAVAFVTLFRVIPAHLFRPIPKSGSKHQKPSILRRLILGAWETLGPISNYIIYVSIALYFYFRQGCDVMQGNRISIFKDPVSKNVYYEAEGKWIAALEKLYISSPAVVPLKNHSLMAINRAGGMEVSFQIRSEIHIFELIFDNYGWACLADLLFTLVVMVIFYAVFDPWTFASDAGRRRRWTRSMTHRPSIRDNGLKKGRAAGDEGDNDDHDEEYEHIENEPRDYFVTQRPKLKNRKSPNRRNSKTVRHMHNSDIDESPKSSFNNNENANDETPVFSFPDSSSLAPTRTQKPSTSSSNAPLLSPTSPGMVLFKEIEEESRFW